MPTKVTIPLFILSLLIDISAVAVTMGGVSF